MGGNVKAEKLLDEKRFPSTGITVSQGKFAGA
jgi:hypothetical protein